MRRKWVLGVITLIIVIFFIVPTMITCAQEEEGQGRTRDRENSSTHILSRLLGYFAIGGLIISILLGFRQARRFLVVRSRFTAKGIQRLHCWISYIATALVIVHGILPTFTRKWGAIYSWWEFYPKFRMPTSWNLSSLLNDQIFGIELGDWSFLIMIVAIIGGERFKGLLRRIGRRWTILFQQLTYFGLFLGVLHAKMDGKWANDYPLLFYILLIAMVVLVGMRLLIAIRGRKRRV